MFPYRFDPHDDQHAQPAPVTPATRPHVAPGAGMAEVTKRRGRSATAAMLALALATGAVGGGAGGAVAATRWLGPQSQPAPITNPQPISVSGAMAQSVAGAVFNSVSDAVVEIISVGEAGSGPMSSGSGSGSVVDARGLILTNNHVVEGARAVSVRFSDGTTREAQILGADSGNDLALLRVDLPEDVPVALLGDSDAVQVGETAIAIGSPFGLDQTVTQGIISAIKRTWWPGNGRAQRNLLQTDAPINPGNSGGPLLNARGEVIGVNSMIESPVRGSVGVGFAIPINTAKRLIPALESGAQLEPVWLGIQGVDLDATIAGDQGLTVEAGVLVTALVPNGPAAKAGLQGGVQANETIPRGGDVITAVDGDAITDLASLSERLSSHQPGDTVALTITRDGREQQIDVTLEAWSE